jgi:hypothetical protein
MATRIGTNWEGIPHTRTTANIVELRKVTGVRVVRIDNGSFRNASVSGYFELASPDSQVKVDKNGTRTIEVKLGWFGVKPQKTGWANVTILNGHNILDNFTGCVFHNISGKRRDD